MGDRFAALRERVVDLWTTNAIYILFPGAVLAWIGLAYLMFWDVL